VLSLFVYEVKLSNRETRLRFRITIQKFYLMQN